MLGAASASAGPPYQTDDPEPTELGHWEVYSFASGLEGGGVAAGETGIDANYGAAKDLQLTVVTPLAFTTNAGGAFGPGMLDLGAKYRFIHQQQGGLVPDVSFFPQVFLPTSTRAIVASPVSVASDRLNLLLPLWAQKDWGPWSMFGGGGWYYNPGPGERNYWTGGLALTRDVTSHLNLGVEVWAHTQDLANDRSFAGANLGAIYRLSPHWALLASGGPELTGDPQEGRWDFYFSLEANF